MCTKCNDPKCPADEISRMERDVPGFQQAWRELSDIGKILLSLSYWELHKWQYAVALLATAGETLPSGDSRPFVACAIMLIQDRTLQVSRETLRGTN